MKYVKLKILQNILNFSELGLNLLPTLQMHLKIKPSLGDNHKEHMQANFYTYCSHNTHNNSVIMYHYINRKLEMNVLDQCTLWYNITK